MRETERVRAAAAGFGEERGATTLTHGDGGGVWTASLFMVLGQRGDGVVLRERGGGAALGQRR
jgi:hypothetical protein